MTTTISTRKTVLGKTLTQQLPDGFRTTYRRTKGRQNNKKEAATLLRRLFTKHEITSPIDNSGQQKGVYKGEENKGEPDGDH